MNDERKYVPPRLMDADEVAAWPSDSGDSTDRLDRAEELPGTKVSEFLRYRQADLDRYVDFLRSKRFGANQ